MRRAMYATITRGLLVFTLVAAGAGVGTAAAQDRPATGHEAEARAHFQAGQALVAQQRFAEAYRRFAAGYELSGRPLFLFNMAECARQSDQLERALQSYRRYLEDEPEGTMAPVARDRLAEVRARLGERFPEPPASTEPAPARSEGVEVAATPSDTAEVAEAESAADRVAPSADVFAPASLRDEDDRRPVWKRWPFWAGIGGAIVGGALVAVVVTQTGGGGGDVSCASGCLDLR